MRSTGPSRPLHSNVVGKPKPQYGLYNREHAELPVKDMTKLSRYMGFGVSREGDDGGQTYAIYRFLGVLDSLIFTPDHIFDLALLSAQNLSEDHYLFPALIQICSTKNPKLA
ncbi:hypothetical protein PGT21_021362 [Puccinia graminis f. sp. tritici]|uniref:Uncharacterized protein n=1 Tax=Puccinia graminis f. sp. tritici TaxID=56615 RepID=A0A5B0RT17_PUCGR|nr:hypothetical protein PGT21_021362 [Puccinia graminis f. sp. tritici]KAA1129156.1 hypothetical protein PGTUg99_032019 [Puccinia graminis f. sp. tritici]